MIRIGDLTEQVAKLVSNELALGVDYSEQTDCVDIFLEEYTTEKTDIRNVMTKTVERINDWIDERENSCSGYINLTALVDSRDWLINKILTPIAKIYGYELKYRYLYGVSMYPIEEEETYDLYDDGAPF